MNVTISLPHCLPFWYSGKCQYYNTITNRCNDSVDVVSRVKKILFLIVIKSVRDMGYNKFGPEITWSLWRTEVRHSYVISQEDIETGGVSLKWKTT